MIKVSMGPEKKSRVVSEKERKQQIQLPLVKTIEDAKVYFDKTKINKPKTLEEVPSDLKKLKVAYTLKTPLKDVELSVLENISKKEMEESIIGLLGGRIAEEIILRRYINRSK